MSSEQAIAEMFEDVFDEHGVAATVQRGAADPETVRIVITQGVNRYGEAGQVLAQVTTVAFLRSEWDPKQGDVVQWSDRNGLRTGVLTAEKYDNGFRSEVVLHG